MKKKTQGRSSKRRTVELFKTECKKRRERKRE